MKCSRSRALAVLLALALSSCAIPEAPARVALLYGVSVYDETPPGGLANPNLNLADDDAIDMATMLGTQGWLTTLRTDADATKVNMLADIASLSGFEGLVVFYYSGHGGQDSLNDNRSVICPRDSWDGTAHVWLFENMPYPEELFAAFEAAGLKHVVVILDSCHSGGFVMEGATTDGVPPLFGPNETPDGSIMYTWQLPATGDAIAAYAASASYGDYIVLSAAGAGDFSWETSTHGIFTGFLLQAPGYADADRDGLITTTELFAFTAVNIQIQWNQWVADDYDNGQYADYHPHVTGSPREYGLLFADN